MMKCTRLPLPPPAEPPPQMIQIQMTERQAQILFSLVNKLEYAEGSMYVNQSHHVKEAHRIARTTVAEYKEFADAMCPSLANSLHIGR